MFWNRLMDRTPTQGIDLSHPPVLKNTWYVLIGYEIFYST
jgi:hypothetical protein